MNGSHYHHLFRIDTVTGIGTAIARMMLAVGVPLVGGGTLGHLLGGIPNANETVVLISALVAG